MRSDRTAYMQEYSRLYRQSKEHKDKAYERNKAYRLANPDRVKRYAQDWRKNNIELARLYARDWNAKNKDYVAASCILYQRRSKCATPKWLDKEEFILVYTNCPDEYHVDHIVPIVGVTPEGYQVSGLNVPWNLQYLTKFENQSKSNRMTARCYEIACSLTK